MSLSAMLNCTRKSHPGKFAVNTIILVHSSKDWEAQCQFGACGKGMFLGHLMAESQWARQTKRRLNLSLHKEAMLELHDSDWSCQDGLSI